MQAMIDFDRFSECKWGKEEDTAWRILTHRSGRRLSPTHRATVRDGAPSSQFWDRETKQLSHARRDGAFSHPCAWFAVLVGAESAPKAPPFE